MAPEIRSHFDGADGTSSAKYLNLRKTVTNVVVIVIESEKPYVVIFFWRKRFGMQTVRVPVGRVPQIKHTCEGRKIPFIKKCL
jgi:hypothetical protein